MQNRFSKYLKKIKPLIIELKEALLAHYPYVSILATDVTGKFYTADPQGANIMERPDNERGIVIKVQHEGRFYEYSTNLVTKRRLPKIVEAVRNLTTFVPVGGGKKLPVPNDEALVASFVRKNKGKKLTDEEVTAELKQAVGLALQDEMIVFAQFLADYQEVSKLFVSNNRDLEQYYNWSEVAGYFVARDDAGTKYYYDGFGDNNWNKIVKSAPKLVKISKDYLQALLKSEPPVPGVYDVITTPDISGLIAHEAFGHGVEMDQFVKDRAISREYLGKKVGSEIITMHDGAAGAHSVASYFFDDEGVLAHDTVIIKDGVMQSGISDFTSALELGLPGTGNSRRENYRHKAYARMTNTYFAPGTSKVKEMIKSIEYGFLVDTMSNGIEDPKNWGIQCTGLIGREIKNGRLTGKVISPVVMSGYVPDFLNSITAVSDEFELNGLGQCGKGYKEWVRTSTGGAHLKARVKIG